MTGVTNATLTRSGTGIGSDPYKVALNLANANTWTGIQTFNNNVNFPASGIWQSNGYVGIGTSTPAQRLDVIGTAKVNGLMMPTNAGRNKVMTSDASGNAAWSNPIIIKSFRGLDSVPPVYYDTNVPSSDYFCYVGGMYLGNSDINEHSGSGQPTYISSCFVNSDNDWWCGGFMNYDFGAPEVRINAVCVAKGMVDSSGYSQIYP